MADVQTTNTNIQENEQSTENGTFTVEKLLAQLAQQKAENAKLKNANDKSSKEAAEYKKQLRAKQTAEEQASEAQREAEEQHKQYVAELEEFRNKTMAKDRYLAQGMPVDLAAKAAEAEISGDMDALATIQKQFTESVVKAKEIEWKKSRPEPQVGVGGEETSVTKEQFNRMGYKQRVEFKSNYPETYKKFVEGE